MPLTGTGSGYVPDDQRRAVGFWMKETEHPQHAPRFVRVFVTYFGLCELDRSKVVGDHSALELLPTHRAIIEKAASTKFDMHGPDDDETFEGRPVLTLREPDLPLVEIA